MLADALRIVAEGRHLTEDEAEASMRDVMSGTAPTELIAGFLAALRVKGETVDEITGFARAMRSAGIRLTPRVHGRLVDTCSTGGARVPTFNVGTTSAFVVAAAGVPVAKHGNRSFNRPSGSADVLEALGVNLALSPERVQRTIETVGVGFLFAPLFHPAMKHAAPARKALGIRTVLNLLGPLSNPAGARAQVLGVYDRAWVQPLAKVLARLGTEHALVVAADGSDEASLAGTTTYAEARDGTVRLGTFTPEDLGLPRTPTASYGPLPPTESAQEVRRILDGGPGPRADAVRLTSGLALYVGGAAPTMRVGVERATDLLHSHRPREKLEEYLQATSRPETLPA